MDDISVLICDDSALMRNLIGRIIDGTEGMNVVAKASNGQQALEKIEESKPDIIVLDIEMPIMNGIEFLKARKEKKIKVPVVVLSSVATKGAAITMQALELGAADFITKPAGSVSADISEVADQLIDMLASYGSQYARRQGKVPYIPEFFQKQRKLLKAESFVANKKADENIPVQKPKLDLAQITSFNTIEKKDPVVVKPLRDGGKIEVIAIGISTGGPNALRDVFKMIDPRLKQPILVVQHMPKGFTKAFAESLDKICPLSVKEAEDGEKIKDATVYIAPGDNHITVEEKGGERFVRLTHDPQRNGHRPSADVMFESVAAVYKNHALGVIMTGMGRDGAAELAEMRKQGAWTLGQDEESSIVYGMPRVGWEMGGVQKQVPLMKMADEISALAREHLTA
ncbi:MAG: chemotaxis response regulator protein-glutamate methylesterase [Treponema sp.]|nr:chemotaxis response regulator protein-glutamate methylesterase [Treponema sp.]MBQ7619515.1 chemotaxis response regulator protein-glutamate methylesterase [Treponema sp.]